MCLSLPLCTAILLWHQVCICQRTGARCCSGSWITTPLPLSTSEVRFLQNKSTVDWRELGSGWEIIKLADIAVRSPYDTCLLCPCSMHLANAAILQTHLNKRTLQMQAKLGRGKLRRWEMCCVNSPPPFTLITHMFLHTSMSDEMWFIGDSFSLTEGWRAGMKQAALVQESVEGKLMRKCGSALNHGRTHVSSCVL